MTQEEKQLLLKDLCARLRCGVKIKIGEHSDYTLYSINPNDSTPIIVSLIENEIEHHIDVSIEHIKPYLRMMSSMTDEESKEFDVITNGERGFYEDEDGWIRCDNIHTKWGVWPKGCAEMLDWLNSHHFDYRGLIPKGLALEAPEGMYK